MRETDCNEMKDDEERSKEKWQKENQGLYYYDIIRYEIRHDDVSMDLFERSNVVVLDKNKIIERFGHFSKRMERGRIWRNVLSKKLNRRISRGRPRRRYRIEGFPNHRRNDKQLGDAENGERWKGRKCWSFITCRKPIKKGFLL